MKEGGIYKLCIDRDGEVCGICKESISAELKKYREWVKFSKEIRRRKRELQREVMEKRKEVFIDIDHILPRAEGGVSELSNLQITHKKCNALKGGQSSKTHY